MKSKKKIATSFSYSSDSNFLFFSIGAAYSHCRANTAQQDQMRRIGMHNKCTHPQHAYTCHTHSL